MSGLALRCAALRGLGRVEADSLSADASVEDCGSSGEGLSGEFCCVVFAGHNSRQAGQTGAGLCELSRGHAVCLKFIFA